MQTAQLLVVLITPGDGVETEFYINTLVKTESKDHMVGSASEDVKSGILKA